MSKMNKILQIVLISASLLIMFVFSFIVYKATQQPVTIKKEHAAEITSVSRPVLSMSPMSVSTMPNESFNIDLMLDTKSGTVSSVDLIVNYNPTFLRANSITVGDFLPVVLKTGSINNGMITITLGCQPTEPKQGVGKLATINFTALKEGADKVVYNSQSLIAAINQTGNYQDPSTGSVITVTTPPVPTSTPATNVINIPTSTPSIPTSTPTFTPTPTPVAVSSPNIDIQVERATLKLNYYWWSKNKNRLTVKVTSNVTNASLSVQNFGKLPYSSRMKAYYKQYATNLTPTSITIMLNGVPKVTYPVTLE